MSPEVLYRWPDAARLGRVVPKAKFYEHGKISNKIREAFVAEVQRITWAYKLADETIHLSPSEQVPEIQIFVIEAKGQDVGDAILRAMDLAVPFPIIFEVHAEYENEARRRMAVALKRLRPTKGPDRLSDHFSTDWVGTSAARVPLPAALDLAELYAALTRPLLPIQSAIGESLESVADRVTAVREVERDLRRLERRLGAEKQFNRKVVMRREIKELEVRLAQLTSPSSHT